MEESYNHIPLAIDPVTKAVSTQTSDSSILEEIAALNALHKTLVSAQSDAVNAIPPPPTTVNPKRSVNVKKAKDNGNNSHKAGKHAEAIRLYTLGIDLAAGRPQWEPSALVREELSGLYANRSQAHMGSQNWPEGAIDAQCSVELKKVGNPKAWWRRGTCLLEMGRLEEADQWVAEAIEFEGAEKDLVDLRASIQKAMERRS